MTVRKGLGKGLGRQALLAFLFAAVWLFAPVRCDASLATVTLEWDPSTDATVIGYRLYYGTSSGNYDNVVTVGKVVTADVPGLTVGVTYYFAATSYTDDGLESDYSNEAVYTVPDGIPNAPPTLDAIADISVKENSGSRTVALSGITSGSATENQVLQVTATSSNPGLIANPAVSYTSPNSTGSLVFTPVAYGEGSAVITVAVNDGQTTTRRSFNVTVIGVNQPPTLDPIGNVSVTQNSGVQTLTLTGISSGAPTEYQALTVSASSSTPSLLGQLTVEYYSPNSTAKLSFAPAQNATGTAEIAVTVNDGIQADAVTRTFTVTIQPLVRPPSLNDLPNLSVAENTGPVSVNLSGITAGTAGSASGAGNPTIIIRATSSNTSLFPNPTVNYVSPSTTGTLVLTPFANSSGTATIAVTVSSDNALAGYSTKSFTVTVSPHNNPPTLAQPSDLAFPEDSGVQLVSLSGISSGSPFENQTLKVTATSSNAQLLPAPGVLYYSPSSTATLTLTPSPNAFGSAVITVTVDDGHSLSNLVSRSFTCTVIPANDPPVIAPIGNVSFLENSPPQVITLTGIGAGAPNEDDRLTLSASSSNVGLIPNPVINYTSPSSTAQLILTPTANSSGSSTITVSVNDGGASNNITSRTFLVTVSPSNQQPTLAALDDVTMAEDSGSRVISLSGISSGAQEENQTLTVTATSSNPDLLPNPIVSYVSPAQWGALSLNPKENAYGTATVTVTVNDGHTLNNTVSRTFTVIVTPVNDPPTLDPIADAVVPQDAPAQRILLSGIDAGAANENQNLSVTAVSSNPNLIPNPSVTYTSPNTSGWLEYKPQPSVYGTASVTVTVSDGQAQNSTAIRIFTVTVTPVNQAPTLDPIQNVVVSGTSAGQKVVLTGITCGTPAENQTLTVTAISDNPSVIANPVVNYTSPSPTADLSITPTGGVGSALITVTVDDGQTVNNITRRTFMVIIDSANRPPTLAVIPDMFVQEDSSEFTVTLSGITSGSTNENQRLVVTARSSNAALLPDPLVSYSSPSTVGSLTLRPRADAFGTATITVTVNDGQSANNTCSQAFNVTMLPVNDPPTLDPISGIAIDENSPSQIINLTGIGSGAPNENNTLTISALSSNPSLIPNPTVYYSSTQTTGSILFTPSPYGFGTATITVSISDNQPTNSILTRSFVVTVRPVNQAPTLNPLPNFVLNSNAGQQTVPLSGISSGATNELQVLSVSAKSSNPSVVADPVIAYTSPSATGSVTFKPAGLAGTAVITVTVNDGQTHNSTFSRTFTVTVNAADEPPTLAAIADVSIDEDSGPQKVQLTGISSGLPTSRQISITALSTRPEIVPDPVVSYTSPDTTGYLMLAPATNAFGTANIIVTVANGQSSVTRTFAVSVAPVNDPPTLDNIENLTLAQNSSPQLISLTGISSGAPNEEQALTVSAFSSNPDVVPHPTVGYSSPGNSGTLLVSATPGASGLSTITVTISDSLQKSTSRSFLVVVQAGNSAPTLDPISNLVVDTTTGEKNLTLTGISSGGGGTQTITVSATSSDPAVVQNPVVQYTSPWSTGLLTLKPAGPGKATISVIVSNGQTQNVTFVRTFEVTVTALNHAPTLDAISDITIAEDSPLFTVKLTGITSGAANEVQGLTVTAVSSNPGLVPNPVVTYSSPNPAATLSLIPTPNVSGSATITVRVDDGSGVNSSITRAFSITVTPVNDPPTLNQIPDVTLEENANSTVVLSGISAGAADETEPLIITASSSNTQLIPTPTVTYSVPATTALLALTPRPNQFGSAILTVRVDDGRGSNNVVMRSFTVQVRPLNKAPTLDPIANLALASNAGQQTVNLSGITSGSALENQPLRVTAKSSNPAVVPDPVVLYQSPNVSGSLRLTPTGVNGTATITVTIDDGQLSNNEVTRSFVVNVDHLNLPPTLNTLSDLVLQESAAARTIKLTGIGSGSQNESQILRVFAYSSDPDVVPDPVIAYTSPGSTADMTLQPVPQAYGTVTIWVIVDDGDTINNTVTRAFTVKVEPVNQAPTLNPIAAVSMSENSAPQTVNLTGISSGSSWEHDVLSVRATSSDPRIVPDPVVSYSSPGTTGRLTLSPTPGAFGSVVITVTVDDGAATNNTTSRVFVVTVDPVNQPPTLDTLGDIVINENAGPQMINLRGISSGATNEFQRLTVTAASSNTRLLPNPRLEYTSPSETGILTITPLPFAFGTAVITVTVNDNDANNNTITRSFTVTVLPVNQPPSLYPLADIVVLENSGKQVVSLSGISSGAVNETEPVTITARSSDPSVVPDPVVTYVFPATTGTLEITPVAYASGVATITVEANDSQPANNITRRSFTVTVKQVNQPPTISAIPDLVLPQNAPTQTIPLNGVTSGAPNESDTLTISATSSNPSVVPTPVVTYTSPLSSGSLRLSVANNAIGTAVVTVSVNDGRVTNGLTSRSFTVTVANQDPAGTPNLPPTLAALAPLSLQEDSGPQTIVLSGISSGSPTELQLLTVTATSSAPSIIPNPIVTYTSPNSTGLLQINPAPNAYGSATITVTVNDGQTTNNVSRRSFTVNISPINDPPTLNAIADLRLPVSPGVQTVQLSGISAGAPNELQAVSISVSSSNPSLIPDPVVTYRSGNTIGSIALNPTSGVTGQAIISVTVNDGQPANNTTVRQFRVAVGPVSAQPTLDSLQNVTLLSSCSLQRIPLTGISSGAAGEIVSVRAISSDPVLLPVSVEYRNPDSAGELLLRPVKNGQGEALITVIAESGSTNVQRTFRAQVRNSAMLLQLDSVAVEAGQQGSIPLRLTAPSGLTNLSVVLPLTPARILNPTLQNLGAELDPATTRVSTTTTNITLQLRTRAGQYFSGGSIPVASLAFTATAGQDSAFVSLQPAQVVAQMAGVAIAEVPIKAEPLVIIGKQALIQTLGIQNGSHKLRLYGKPNASYALQYSSNLVDWKALPRRHAMTSREIELEGLSAGSGPIFYRAVEFTADPPVLEALMNPNGTASVLVFGRPNTSYTLEYSLTTGPGAVWRPVVSRNLTNSFNYESVQQLGPATFFRVRKN